MTWTVFDYGGVLSLPQPESDADAMAEAVGADPETFKRGYWDHRLDFDRATLTPETYWSTVLGRPATAAEVARLDEMDVASWSHPDQGTLAILDALLARGADVALLSNAPASVADGLDRLPWIAAIEHRFYSARMGMVKPDLEIYAALAEGLGAAPGDIVFIDDRKDNIEGAERAGLTTHHFTDAASLRAALSL
ncbi:HAD family hydrolase [Nonomuraea sp. NPDC050536]|uniref:HAD family hydrolase n=1 Tax=Nonomuraea sp. NPDC050536 TaxID=3364366 RepID=UPI0037CB7392